MHEMETRQWLYLPFWPDDKKGSVMRRVYAMGTEFSQSRYGEGISARALCTDGKIRSAAWIALSADTYFSHPAAMRVRNRYIRGFLTVECISGSFVPTDDDPAIVKFFALSNGKHAHLLSNVGAECKREMETAALIYSIRNNDPYARPI